MTDEFTDLVGAYVLNALDDEEMTQVQAHIAQCDACARLADELSSVADRIERNLPPSRLWSKIEANIGSRDKVDETEVQENSDRE